MKYASNTSVSVEKSRAEIEGTLSRYGATKFAYMTEDLRAILAFEIAGKRIRFILPLPNKNDAEFAFKKHYNSTKRRNPEEQHSVWEQSCRQRRRALALAIKAKLEWIETGIVSVEEEFLPYIVTSSGKTIAEMVIPQLNQLYESGKVPRLLLESGN